jgi:hypothetical protein
MTDAERIAQLEAELASLKGSEAPGRLNVKIGNKRNIVVGGKALGQRFPVTLYAPSWLVLLSDENVAAIKQFISDNKDQLSWERE